MNDEALLELIDQVYSTGYADGLGRYRAREPNEFQAEIDKFKKAIPPNANRFYEDGFNRNPMPKDQR